MLKKLSIIISIIFIAIGLTACGINVRLLDSKNIIRIAIADEKTKVIIDDETKINEVVDKLYRYKIESDILPEQDNGKIRLGERIFQIEMRKANEKIFSFELIKYIQDEESEVDYYFQKEVRGLFYLTHKLDTSDEEYIFELFYGDIIILD